MTIRDPEKLADALFEQIDGYVARKLRPLEERLKALEAQQKDLKYAGVFRGGRIYQKGNFVSHNGSVWHADTDTQDKPGASNDWTLAVKAGKDAR